MLIRSLRTWSVVILAAGAVRVANAAETDVVDAVRNRDITSVRTLIGQSADVNAPEADGTTALHWAVHWNDIATVRLLLEAGADARSSNRYGATPLAVAASDADGRIVELLLEAGADPDAPITSFGQTPLMTAARTANIGAARALLEHGAYVDVQENDRGQTALMWAAAEGHADMVRLLLEYGADHRARSRDRATTPPGIAAGTPTAPIYRGGLTALSFAARQGHLDAAVALIEGGADVNHPDSDGNSPLVLAILNTHYDLARYLLDSGADPNVANSQGRAALYTAVDMHTEDWSPLPDRPELDRVSTMDMIGMLLDHGADVNARLTGPSPIRKVAQDAGDKTMAEGATPFLRAARSADTQLMQYLIDHGADPELTADDGLNALIVAAGFGWSDKIQGTEEDALETVRMLVDLGFDVNGATKSGYTALHGASHRGANSIVQYLVDTGAELDPQNEDHFTPLDIAMGRTKTPGVYQGPRESTVDLLRQLGAAVGPEPETEADTDAP